MLKPIPKRTMPPIVSAYWLKRAGTLTILFICKPITVNSMATTPITNAGNQILTLSIATLNPTANASILVATDSMIRESPLVGSTFRFSLSFFRKASIIILLPTKDNNAKATQ